MKWLALLLLCGCTVEPPRAGPDFPTRFRRARVRWDNQEALLSPAAYTAAYETIVFVVEDAEPICGPGARGCIHVGTGDAVMWVEDINSIPHELWHSMSHVDGWGDIEPGVDTDPMHCGAVWDWPLEERCR